MVRCPKCNRTYENDSQKFCTRDGGRLIAVDAGSANFNPNATMVSGSTPSFDPNATMVSPQQNPNVSQQSFDPNATVISPPTPSQPPAKPQTPASSSSYSDQQNFPTVAGVQIPQSQPAENPYASQSNIQSTPYSSTADIQPSQPPQPRASGPLSQPVQVPMPARYDSSAPTSSDLVMPPNVSAPTSGDLGQTTVPPPPAPTDFGYTTGRSSSPPASTDFGYTTGRSSSPAPPENVNYPQTGSGKTSSDLRFPEAAADMQTQALVSPPSQSFKTSNTGELAKPITAPPAANPMPVPPQAPAIGAQPKKKSSGKMVLIGLGAVFFALLIVVVGVGVFIITQHPEWVGMGKKTNNNENVSVNNNENTSPNTNQSNESNTNTNNTNTNTNTNENTNTAPVEPPPNSTQFVNSSAGLSGDLASHFVPFSFYYPQAWKKFPNAELFVQVNRQASGGLQETFAVGNYDSKGTFDADKADFATLIQPHETRLAKDIPGYQKISEGETTINGISGYEIKFTGTSQNSDVKFFGRLVLLPPGKDGEKNGVKLLIVATSLTPEIQSVNDVGVKGELPVILSTFKLGK